MRITARVASMGDSWFPRWPVCDLDACFPKVDGGGEKFDEANFRWQMRNQPAVQIAADDYGTPLAVGALIISSVRDWMNDMDKSGDEGVRGRRVQQMLNRKLNAERVGFVRIDLTGVTTSMGGKKVRLARVKITTKDSGRPERFDFSHEFALVIADFFREYSKRWEARGEAPLIFTPEVDAFLSDLAERRKEAEEEEAIEKANEKRWHCENRHGDFCSPCQFECPCFSGGKCVEARR